MGIFQPRLMEMVYMTQLCVRREPCFIQRIWVDSGQPCFKAVTPLLLHPSAEALGAGAHRSRILRPETELFGEGSVPVAKPGARARSCGEGHLTDAAGVRDGKAHQAVPCSFGAPGPLTRM